MRVTEISCDDALVGWARNEEEASLLIKFHCRDFGCSPATMTFKQSDVQEQYLLHDEDLDELRRRD